MRVETIYLKETGPFAELRLDFQPKLADDKADVHILVGQNGTGKSTILIAIAGAFSPHKANINLVKRLHGVDSWMEVKANNRFIAFSIQNGTQLYDKRTSRINSKISLYGIGQKGEKFLIFDPEDEDSQFTSYLSKIFNASTSVNLDYVAFAYSGYRSFFSSTLNKIEETKENPIDDAINFDKTTKDYYEKIIHWITLVKSKAALAAYRNDQKTARKREESIARIENLVAQIIDKPIKFEITDEPLAVNLRIDGRVSDFDVLPDGLKSILGWVTDLMMRMELIPWENHLPIFERQFLLLLDEIEVHLHPAWQRKILPVLQKLFPHAQIILSTHSPFVVGSVSDAWVYPLRLDDAGNAVLDTPIKSKAGVSYPAIVEEVFGIDEEFDEYTENQLDRFEEKKKAYLQGQLSLADLQTFGANIAKDSVEVNNIVSREIRQAERLRKQQGLPAA